MTIADAITATYLKAVGKTTTPSTSKYNKIVALLDYYQRGWSNENEIDWNSLYTPNFSLGNVTATDAYDLDTSSIRKLSDREGDAVRIMWTDGTGYSDYKIVPADELKDYFWGQNKESYNGKYCTRIGSQLVFNHEFLSTDPEYGGDIQVPVYAFADAITSDSPDSDEVQVDNPDWLVTRAAAEYVRTDITRQGQYPNLLAEANNIMERMKADNDDVQVNMVNRPWTPGVSTDSTWS